MPERKPHRYAPAQAACSALLFVLFVVLLTGSAAGKNSEKARLLSKLPLHATPGHLIRVKWTVEDQPPRGKAVPFGASGMFVRLTGTPGHTMESFAPPHGPPYVAWVGVPAGGIKQIKLGLLGWTQDTRTGATIPAPVYFPIVNSPFKHH